MSQKMQFIIIPMSYSKTNNETTVEVNETIWTIRQIWGSRQIGFGGGFGGGDAELSAVQVQRSHNKDGRVNIELVLHYRKDAPSLLFSSLSNCILPCSKTFKATLNNEYSCSISTSLSPPVGYHFVGHVTISPNCQNANKSDEPTTSSPSKLSNDFLRLLDNPSSFPDATLRSGSVAIPVHRNILSVRSPVLAAMFSSQMQEGLGSTVNITDIQPEVLQSTLRYIYGGKTDGLTDALAADMLFAADKYQLEELKSVCITKLKSSVTVDNVFRILVLGNLHDKSLKTHAVDFLCQCNCFSKLEETEEWKRLEKEYPSLAMEVLKSIVKSVEQRK